MVPYENSTNGQVVFTFDLLRDWFVTLDKKPSFSVVAEEYVAIHHYILSNCEDLSKVETLYSHPQVWGQVTKYLSLGPLSKAVRRVDTSSTAKAAELVKNDATNLSACISSEMSANLYDLPIRGSSIEDVLENTTRFLVLGYSSIPVSKNAPMITSLMLVLNNNDPGSLCSALDSFRTNDVNLTTIASRPSGITQWEYVFFVEAEGGLDTAKMQKLVESLKESCTKVVVLGTFERAR